ncbi:glutamine amidotransferase-related protein [Candidatus Carsonella ruddii]|uniref:glutamine amidotransferase-related protein n=1 Tax=Carsonella ruddii TaxID=114186 RepID=UPI003D9A3222
MILFLDNYDSFSNNIIKKICFKKIKINFITFSINNFYINFIVEKIIFFGPGPNNTINSNLNSIIIDKFIGKKKLIGLCLGHQIISCYFGYKIFKLNIFFHGQFKKIIFFLNKYKIFITKKIISYNSLSCIGFYRLKNFSKKNFELFIINNNFLKIKSYQFHPESIISNKNIFI